MPHFSMAEFDERRKKLQASMEQRGLDALLMFRQESMYYLTGYDTFGYCFFQCLILDAGGDYSLLTRAPDLRQARHTSIIEDIVIWQDRQNAHPAGMLVDLMRQRGLDNARVGIEWEAYGLTAHNGRQLEAAIADFCRLEDASMLVSELRLVKSPDEIAYVRRAAQLADQALASACELAAPGVFEGDILAAMHSAIFSGGGDYPGNEFIIGSGHNALLCRYYSGRRHLSDSDQLTLEFAGTYRHYHACLMRTLLVGARDPLQEKMYVVCREALKACMDRVVPGKTMGEVFDAHARVFDQHGFQAHRMNACGYSLGSTFTPTWMDWPMFYTGNPVTIRPHMVFFLHMILMDSERRLAMTLGQTVLTTDTACESLHGGGLELLRV